MQTLTHVSCRLFINSDWERQAAKIIDEHDKRLK